MTRMTNTTTMTTRTSLVTDTTRNDEQAATESETRDNQRPGSQTNPYPETGTAYLPGATPGASAVNWK